MAERIAKREGATGVKTAASTTPDMTDLNSSQYAYQYCTRGGTKSVSG